MTVNLLVLLALFYSGGCISSLTLFKGASVYTPTRMGKMDVLIGGTKVLSIAPQIDVGPLIGITNIIDASGKILIPGIVDVHVHATGGGGEMGPYSRTPEAQFEQIVDSGTTTIVGVLGTDGISRSLPNLLVKLNGLEDLGLSTFMWSGNYRVPPPTLTGSVFSDIVLIKKVIGFGEIAIADHRSSAPSLDELCRLIADGRVAGMLSAKAGVTYFHVGSGKAKIDQLFEILKTTDIPITQMYPTHMNGRGDALLEQGIVWLKSGGRLDFTADGDNDTEAAAALDKLVRQGIRLENVSVSSDAYGSIPKFDSNGILIKYDYQRPSVLSNMIKKMVLKLNWKLEDILPLFTSNPARFLGLGKGQILAGGDADLVLLEETTLNVSYVYSKGEVLKTPIWNKPSLFKCE